MKALTLKQPWASLIASGRKTIELRSRRTHYRGDVLILAGKGRALKDPILVSAFAGFPDGALVYSTAFVRSQAGLPWTEAVTLPAGQAVCIATITDCRPATEGDCDAACCPVPADHFAWTLENIRPVEPFKVTGRLGFFEIEDRLIVVRKAT